MHPMSPIYADLIKDDLKTIDQVPEKNRAEVQALIDADAAD
ncbi:CD1375 family protein [Brevibacillus sp. NRS-1366]